MHTVEVHAGHSLRPVTEELGSELFFGHLRFVEPKVFQQLLQRPVLDRGTGAQPESAVQDVLGPPGLLLGGLGLGGLNRLHRLKIGLFVLAS